MGRVWLLALSAAPGRLIVCALIFEPVDLLFRHVIGAPDWLRIATMLTLYAIALLRLFPNVAEVERRLDRLDAEDRLR